MVLNLFGYFAFYHADKVKAIFYAKMKIKLIWIGKTSENYLQQGISIYMNRLQHYCRFESQEIIIPKKFNALPESALKKKEAEALLNSLEQGTKLILLDEKGSQQNSVQFADFINKQQVDGIPSLTFVIGGAFGFDESLYQKADLKFSLSSMTFSHQMIRLFILEQLYRAYTIIKGESYHNA